MKELVMQIQQTSTEFHHHYFRAGRSTPKADVSNQSKKAPNDTKVASEIGMAVDEKQQTFISTTDIEKKAEQNSEKKEETSDSIKGKNAVTGEALSDEEKREVEELKERDAEVRAHEQAHIAAGGQHVKGVARFEYKTSPDGKKYAVGGEVSIDTSKVPNDPDATIAKMRAIKKAALAPANPSATDRSVASKAAMIEARMRMELNRLEREENTLPDKNTLQQPGYPEPAVETGSSIDYHI